MCFSFFLLLLLLLLLLSIYFNTSYDVFLTFTKEFFSAWTHLKSICKVISGCKTQAQTETAKLCEIFPHIKADNYSFCDGSMKCQETLFLYTFLFVSSTRKSRDLCPRTQISEVNFLTFSYISIRLCSDIIDFKLTEEICLQKQFKHLAAITFILSCVCGHFENVS